MKFRFAMKKIMFTLLLIANEMKYNFVSVVVEVNRTIKIYKQTIETSMLEATVQAFIEEILR